MRIGQGFDLHKLVAGRKLIIGGVLIDSPLGLEGHSDADVLIHALIDALIGALALGDIGQFFPDTDPQFKNISSRILLRQILRAVQVRNYLIANIDATVILQQPKLSHYIPLMRQNLAADLEITIEQINIKAKTSEGIGIIGRAEAASALVNVLLLCKK